MYHWNFLILWVIKSNIRWHLCFCYLTICYFLIEMSVYVMKCVHDLRNRSTYKEVSTWKLRYPFPRWILQYICIVEYVTLNFMLYFSYLVPHKVRNTATKMKGPYMSLNVDFNIQNKTMLLFIWLNGSVLNCKCI